MTPTTTLESLATTPADILERCCTPSGNNSGLTLRALGTSAIFLKVTDIDSQCMMLRIEQGKGRKCVAEHLRPYVFKKLMLP
jgi:hypothetical protein